MKISGFDHVNLSVRSFDETAAWYGRVFGFRVVEEDRTGDVVWGVLRAGDTMLCIYEYPDREFWSRHVHRERRVHGVNHFGLRIADETAWRATLEREKLDAEEWRWPHSLAWYVHDPTGYEIEVVLWDGDRVAFDAVT